MSTHPRLWLAAVGALAAPLLFAVATSAGDPEPLASAPPLDAGVGDADGEAGPPLLPSFRAEPFPETRSPEPKAAEWPLVSRVTLDRSAVGLFVEHQGAGIGSGRCEARRKREWIQIRCAFDTGVVSLLGGNVDGLALRLDPEEKQDFPVFPAGAEVVFPVRRGDRRVIEWLEAASGYKGLRSVEPAFVLSEQWPAGDEAPSIVAE
jgi:hypothetical protein